MKLNIRLPQESAEELIKAFEKKDPELQKHLPLFPILGIRKSSVKGKTVVILAATLIGIAILLGVTVWLAYLAVTGPAMNVAIANLFPLSTRSGDGVRVELAADQELVLILNLPPGNGASVFSAEIVPWSDVSPRWAFHNLRRQEGGLVTLRLPSKYLPMGRYRLRLFELDNAGQPFSEYEFHLVPNRSVN